MTDSSPVEEHPFNADRPIAGAADDRLDRGRFTAGIASALNSWRGRESLVLGIFGPWGSGKSSAKNMVVERLAALPAGPLVVEFTPWQWAGQQQLAAGFFAEIEIALGKVDPSKKGKERAKQWAVYAAQLKVGGAITSGLRDAIAAVLVVAGGITVAAGSGIGWLTTLVQVLGALLVVFGVLMAFGARVSSAVADLFATTAAHADRPLEDVRRALQEELANLPRPILVIIDDIDRLSADETRLLMQLVKANADFPNLIYLLLMDRGVVEKALSTDSIEGRSYLEKIVQVGFDLPALDQSRIQRILFADLDRVLDGPGVNDRFVQAHWQQVFYAGLRPYFESIRDVRRFTSALSFDVSLVLNDDVLEVNPVDLIAISAVRMFEPNLYRALPSAKALLTQKSSSSGFTGPRNDDVEMGVEDLITLVPEARRSTTKELLGALFPQISWVFGGSRLGGAPEDDWYKELRVCHQHVFDRYFQLALPQGDLSQRDIDVVTNFNGDSPALAAHLRQLQLRGLLEVLFDRLEVYKTSLPLAHASELVTAILDVGDSLAEDSGGMFGVSPSMHASRIIHWFVAEEADPARRLQILEDAVRATTGLTLAIRVVALETGTTEEREENPDFYLVDAEGELQLTRLMVTKIEAAAQSGDLVHAPSLVSILYRWRDWAGNDAPRAWASGQAATSNGFLELLCGFVGDVHISASGSYGSQTKQVVRLSDLEAFVDLEFARSKLEELAGKSLTERESVAVAALRKAFERRDAGKPEDSFGD